MSITSSNTHKGIIRGRTIELTEEPGLPDGQEVTVVVQCITPTPEQFPPGEGLRRAFGACADEADDLDKFLAWSRQQRKMGRAPIEP